MFEYASARWGTRVVLLRLNYAVELRYGVLVDIGLAVFERRPIDLAMPKVNVIWQGEANAWCLRSFPFCQAPPLVLNITGSRNAVGPRTGARVWPAFRDCSRLSRPKLKARARCSATPAKHENCLAIPNISPQEMISWIANWIANGGPLLNKPTHFQARDGRF